MKKGFLLFILCVSAISYAAAGSSIKDYLDKKTPLKKETLKKESKRLIPKLNSFESHSFKCKEALKKLEEPIKKNEIFPVLSPGHQKAYPVSERQTKDQLDSIVFVDHLGNGINKMEFYFNEKFWSIKQINSFWNSNTKSYDPEEEFTLNWNDDGYLMSFISFSPKWNEGVKEEYTYNEQYLGNSKTISIFIEGNWEYIEKFTYDYDNRGNPTGLQYFSFDGSSWVNIGKEVAAYNEDNKQILFESYLWDGGNWIGDVKEESKWIPGEELVTEILTYKWDAEQNAWVTISKIAQEFENGKITLQQVSYWNKEREDWSGEEDMYGIGDLWYNWKTDYTYDDQGRQTKEIAYTLVNRIWIPTYEYESLWGVADNGELELHRKGYTYVSSENKNQDQDLIVRYCAYYQDLSLEKFTYRKETHKKGSTWQDLFEEVYVYDDAGNLLEETFWNFANNVKLAETSMKYTYDSDSNVSELKIYFGEGGSEEDWILDATLRYEYENGFRVRAYRYLGEELTPDLGNGVDYDFSIPVSDLIVFIGVHEDPYKLLYLYEYEGNGTGFNESKRIFYYSPQNTVGLKKVEKNNPISLYPNPATDLISIQSPDQAVRVTIYNVNGVKLMQTSDKQINVSALAPGLYLVDVNGIKTKFIKK